MSPCFMFDMLEEAKRYLESLGWVGPETLQTILSQEREECVKQVKSLQKALEVAEWALKELADKPFLSSDSTEFFAKEILAKIRELKGE